MARLRLLLLTLLCLPLAAHAGFITVHIDRVDIVDPSAGDPDIFLTIRGDSPIYGTSSYTAASHIIEADGDYSTLVYNWAVSFSPGTDHFDIAVWEDDFFSGDEL